MDYDKRFMTNEYKICLFRALNTTDASPRQGKMGHHSDFTFSKVTSLQGSREPFGSNIHARRTRMWFRKKPVNPTPEYP